MQVSLPGDPLNCLQSILDAAARSMTGQLISKTLPQDNKIRLYKTYIMSVLMSACETWAIPRYLCTCVHGLTHEDSLFSPYQMHCQVTVRVSASFRHGNRAPLEINKSHSAQCPHPRPPPCPCDSQASA